MFQTYESGDADAEQTVELSASEHIVGYLSHAFRGKVAYHYDFQFVVMTDIVRDDLQVFECFSHIVQRVCRDSLSG